MERIDGEKIDYILIGLIIVLVGTGMALLFSASYYHSEKLGKGPLYLFNKQLFFLGIGSLFLILLSRIKTEHLQKIVPLVLLIGLVLLFLPFVPGLGKEINGAKRWIIVFGYSFQPSEFAKLALVLYLAYILQKKEDRLAEPLRSLLPPLVIVFFFAVIIFFQNDLSTSLFVILLALLMFFIAKVPFLYFLYFGSLFIPLAGLLMLTKNYWVEKIITYFDPSRDPYHYGFQIRHSRLAFMMGGLWGRGLGMGSQKLGFLPEADSDYIFAVVGEELGFIGILAVVALFGLFAWRAYAIAFKAQDNFSYFLGFGLTTLIFFQALLNMLVTAGLIPATGMPLPFFSLGGSALVVNMACCGIIISLSRKKKAQGELWYG